MPLSSTTLPVKAISVILTVLIVGLNIARFLALEVSPPGFYIDEAAASMNSMCLAQEGTDYAGRRLPLYSAMEFGGMVVNAPFLYSGAAWVSLFGDSIGALRAMSAFFTVVALFGVHSIGRSLVSPFAGLMVLFVGSLSPWAFQFSRIAWDPPLAPAYFVWGVFFLVCRRTLLSAMGAGALFALAAYAYQATRVQVLLFLIPTLPSLYFFAGHSLKRLLLFGLACGTLLVPLAVALLSPELQTRFNAVGIFSSHYLHSIGYDDSLWSIAGVFFRNFLKHLSVDYLLLLGDGNLRHSSRAVGILSPLDALAFAFGVFFLIEKGVCLRGRWTAFPLEASSQDQQYLALFLVAVLGIFSGISPAALTWESIPHALRSIGAWPFVALLSGTILHFVVLRWRHAFGVIGIVSVAYLAYFGRYYFIEYPFHSRPWFDVSVVEAARGAAVTGEWGSFIREHPDYPDSGLRYHLMHYRGDTCSGSRAVIDEVRR